ncbi:hypothetical protein AB0H76_19485 [Nocardia sp. NPDC050712]|uniref:hypothetical protein n=1 Tax=Nocardia sp. NPDC050712 TaxID=3155518 RepID=UPI003405FB5F
MRILPVFAGVLTALAVTATVAAAPAAAKDTDVNVQEQCQTQYPKTDSHKVGVAYLVDKNNAYTWRCKQEPAGSAKARNDLSVDVQAYCARHNTGKAMARDIHNAYSWKCATTPMPGTGDNWVDCSGPSVCTKYWSRTKTRDLNKSLSTAKLADGSYGAAFFCGLGAFLASGGPLMPLLGAGVAAVVGATCKAGASAILPWQLNGLDTAAAAAVPANGCLQVAYPKDEKEGDRRWSYTTDSGYCWEK